MQCPFCSFEGPPRMLHAHLGDQHPEAIRFEDRGERWFYALDCPLCGDGYEREIKPRGRDPGFVEEFSAQIRLVAFDMLVNHLLGEHEDLEIPDDEDEDEPETTEVPVAGPVPSWLAEARRAKQQNGN
ncbi:MAG TPA: hypothetical protein VFF24_09365 [Acidimicrobiia bacterium]|nr:hypothetical protein [Acidimicrobiia bacterium]